MSVSKRLDLQPVQASSLGTRRDECKILGHRINIVKIEIGDKWALKMELPTAFDPNIVRHVIRGGYDSESDSEVRKRDRPGPKHDQYRMVIHRCSKKNADRGTLIKGIDVVVSAPPSRGVKMAIPTVTVYNWKCNTLDKMTPEQTVKYQRLIFKAIIHMYDPRLHITTDCYVFDIGKGYEKGEASSKYIATVFSLNRAAHGTAVLSKGVE
jgi:hypothetical protein